VLNVTPPIEGARELLSGAKVSSAYMLPLFNNLLALDTSSGSTKIFAVWNVDE